MLAAQKSYIPECGGFGLPAFAMSSAFQILRRISSVLRLTPALLLVLSATYAIAADIPINVEFARDGANIVANVDFDIPAGYHAYAHNPGATGKPTDLDFVIEGYGAVPIIYPEGAQEKDIYQPELIANVYSGRINILAVAPDHTSGKMYAATLEMLLCSSRHCLPFKETFSGSVPNQIPRLGEVSWQAVARTLLAQASASGSISFEAGSAPPSRNEAASEDDVLRVAPMPALDKAEAAFKGPRDFYLELSPRYVDEGLEIYSLSKALLFGIIAGLLLNAMPCVLPVLTLKISGILMMGNAEGKLRTFRMHNICFAAGIFTLFSLLALLLGAADLIWGQLYQNQYLLLAMLLIVFLMGLSMLGVFTLPAFDLRVGEDTANPLLKSYLTGLVSTFLATPCSGPLLGGVLAWAFSQPLPILMAVFWSVGLGMALPYIAFSIWPGLARILPRPGAWMLVFERILGFLLLATALYLLYILPEEKRMAILCILLLAAFCAWFWGAFCGLDSPRWLRKGAAFIIIATISASIYWALRPEAPAPVWQAFSAKSFASELGHREMLVEFTADWCPNCKFLEASVLTDKNLRAWKKLYGLELVKVDLTRSNPYAENLLAQLGSKSIPLTALFSRGVKARSPLVLRDLYSQKTLEDALAEAF